MSDPGKAVFLSYASQDKEVARKICDALRAAGLEVWFDVSELRGGDAWDQKIRKQIRECALFVPLITPTTNSRPEGYFRLEWKLAVDRSHLMADDAAFLFPIAVGDVNDATARVPDKFREVQWTRLRLDETPGEIAARVTRLLSVGASLDDARGRAQGAPLQGKKKEPSLPRKWFKYVVLVVLAFYALRGVVRTIIRDIRGDEEKPAAVKPAEPEAPATPKLSEARQLADRARAMSLDKYDSSIDDYTAAEGLVKKALELDSNDAEIWAISSLLNFGFNSRGFEHTPARSAAARAHAERALKLDPNSIEALFALGRWQRDNEEPALAEATLLKVLARNPEHSGALHSLGYLYDRLDRLDEAASMYAREARNPAAAPLAGFTEYLMFFRRGRFAEADAAVRKSIAAEPSSNAQSGLAMLLLTWKGDAEGAAAAVASGPATIRREHRPIWVTAYAHLCRRKPDEALRVLDRLSDEFILDNTYTGPKSYFIGLAHAQAGRDAAARVAWEAGLALVEQRLRATPADFQLHLARGELLAWLGREADALEEAKVLEQLRFQEQSWIFTPVRIHAALGRVDDALKIIEKQLQFTREHRNLGWHLTPALLRVDPRWDKIRNDPRFQKLCEEPTVSEAENPPAPLSPARELVAKARQLFAGIDNTREDLVLAEDYCQRALKLDPSDGEVWAMMSEVDSAFVYRGWDTSAERREHTRMTAERAIRLAPKSIEARIAQAGAWSTFGVNRAETEKLLREVVQDQPDHQGALRFLAVTVLSQGNLDECLALNERSAALPGGDPLALFNNARYLLQRGRTVEADETLKRAIAQKPFSSAYTLKVQMEIILRGDLDAADAAMAQVPQSALLEDRPNILAGFQKFYRGDGAGALAIWNTFPRDYYMDFVYDGPRDLLVGLAYELDQRAAAAKLAWQAALQLVDKKITAAPTNPAPYQYRAYLLACLGDKAGAEEALRTYQELTGFKWESDGGRAFSLALVYVRLGRFDPVFEHVLPKSFPRISIDPRFAALRADPRYAAFAAKRPPLKSATASITRDWPKSPELKKAVALLDRFDCIPEDLRLAEEIAQRALDQAPTAPETVTAMARVQAMWLNRGWDRSSDRYLKAQRIAERAVQLAPDEPEALAALANYLNQRGNNVARASQLLDRAIALAPNEPRFHRWRNELIWGDRSVPDAVAFAAVERMLVQFPNDALVHYDASRHYRLRGRLDDSLREIEATLALAPVANAFVWKARILFGFHNDLPAMKAALDLVPERVRSIERTVFGYFVYAVMSGDYAVGVKALNDMPDPWMIDFDYRGPKALLLASLLEQQHKPALARIQYEIALKEVKQRQASEPDDIWLKSDEAWILHGLGRGEEARAAARVFNESLERPYRVPRAGSWWFYPIACNLIVGERNTAVTLIREAAETKDGRETVRRFLAMDPRLVAFRDDAEIKAILAEKTAAAAE